MNSIRLFKNAKVTCRIFYPRYYFSFSNIEQNFQCYPNTSWRIKRLSHLNASFRLVKYISNCNSMQTKDSDTIGEKSDDEKKQKILEDEEFQNILKDFANDFGVDSETNEILDDIRKNIDEDYKKNNLQTRRSTNSKVSPILGGGLDHTYKEFSDSDSTVIQSYEESELFEDESVYHIDQELQSQLPYGDLKRGITGVFDIDEMINVLHNENLLDITAISVPKELHYTDFLVLATAKSERHSDAVAESIKKLYKKKKSRKDPFVIVEGEDAPEWKVMDMGPVKSMVEGRNPRKTNWGSYREDLLLLSRGFSGNIVLHIFLEDTRSLYDLESLWLLDSKYDTGGNAQRDPMLDIMEEQLAFFNSLEQSNAPEMPKDSS